MARTKLTQTAAARAANVSRTTIYRALRDGRLSCDKDAHGAVRIDASELLRLFPEADLVRAERTHVDAHERGVPYEAAAYEQVTRTLIDELQRDKLHLQAELTRASEERAQLLSMLATKDRLLEEQTQTLRLLTDTRVRICCVERRPVSG
jgi:hypothetical protein